MRKRRPVSPILLASLLGLAASGDCAPVDALAGVRDKYLVITYSFTSDYTISARQRTDETLRRSDVFRVRKLLHPLSPGTAEYSSSEFPDYGDTFYVLAQLGKKMSFPARPGNPRLICSPACQVGEASGSAEVTARGPEIVLSDSISGTCRCPTTDGGTAVFTTMLHGTTRIALHDGSCEVANYAWSRSWRGVSMKAEEPPLNERATQSVSTPISSSCSIAASPPKM